MSTASLYAPFTEQLKKDGVYNENTTLYMEYKIGMYAANSHHSVDVHISNIY